MPLKPLLRICDCTDQSRADDWLKAIDAATLTAVDTETTSLEPMHAQLVGISLCCEAAACYIPLAHTAPIRRISYRVSWC
jgi:DNA polymerase I-like protein with 3'-5' exonuclease and polymerase domains